MSGFQIYLSEVLRRYEGSGMTSEGETFSLHYEYLDNERNVTKRIFEGCRRRTANTYNTEKRVYKDLRGIKNEQREHNKLHVEFFEHGKWIPRKLFIAQVTHFNGLLIDHRF